MRFDNPLHANLAVLLEGAGREVREAKRCTYDLGYRVCNTMLGLEEQGPFCAEHAAEKCSSCKAPATHDCPEPLQLMCGHPLCDACTHTGKTMWSTTHGPKAPT